MRRTAAAALLGLGVLAAAPQEVDAAPCVGDPEPLGAFWSACMTVGKSALLQLHGYDGGSKTGALSHLTINQGGRTYQVLGLYYRPGGATVGVQILTGPVPGSEADGWVLQIGQNQLLFSDAMGASNASRRWPSPGFTWTDADLGKQFTVSLRDTNKDRHLTVDEGSSATFQWTPPGSPTTARPVTWYFEPAGAFITPLSLTYKVSVSPPSATFTSSSPVTVRVTAKQDGDWSDDIARVEIGRSRALLSRDGYTVHVRIRDDDTNGPGETNGCDAKPAAAFWSTCMKVGRSPDFSGGHERGYHPPVARWSGLRGYGGLDDTTFTKGGEHVIDKVALRTGHQKRLDLSFASDPRPASNGWVLKVGSDSFNLSDVDWRSVGASNNTGVWTESYTYSWADPGISWGDGSRTELILFDIPAPTGVSASPGDRQATLDWTAPSGVTATGYEVRVCPGRAGKCQVGHITVRGAEGKFNGPWETGSASPGWTVSKWHDAPEIGKLKNGRTYTVQVRAVTAVGKGAWSDELQFVSGSSLQVSPPGLPGLSARPGDGEVGLTWTAPEGDTDRITSWQVRHGELDPATGVVDWDDWTDIDGSTAATSSHTVDGLDNGTAYGIQVRAMAGEVEGAESATMVVTPQARPGLLTGFVMVDASTDVDLGGVLGGATVEASAIGSYGFRAETEEGSVVGSVVLSLGGAKTVSRTENYAPYSLYGDDYRGTRRVYGEALPAGSYTLSATAYAERGGSGDVLGKRSVSFTVEAVEAPGPLTGFVLVDISDQSTVATLAEGTEVDLGANGGGSYGIKATVAQDATIGSVVLSLGGAKTVSRTENIAPYSLWGDSLWRDPGGGIYGRALPAGSYTLSATAYAEKRGGGAKLGTLSVSFSVLEQPPTFSVADARAEEGTDASLDFVVTLSRSAGEAVWVAYATSDGTATAGEDYTQTSGRLTFQPGETSKTVSVPVLDDAVDEGEETMQLQLWMSSAEIADDEAEGIIANSDPLQKMWLARFGRTAASQVVDAVADRLAAPLAGARVTLGGQTLDLAREEDGALLADSLTAVARALGAPAGPAPGMEDEPDAWPDMYRGAWDRPETTMAARTVTGRELLLGSAFHLASNGEGEGPGLAAWGRVTVGGFEGEAPAETGNVRMDGEVTTGILGADASWRRLLAGVAVSVSEGEGTFDYAGADARGTVESSLTGVHPYARLDLSERIHAWGLLGWGTGDMTLTQEANETRARVVARTDIEMRLAAVGGRGALLEADDGGGLELALKADAFLVRMESARAENSAATSADASRLRLALEGSRTFEMGGSTTLTPGLELGVRHDGGDAETGTGVELGGRIAWTDAASGLSMEASARTLIAHEDSDYGEWGASGSVRLDPGASGRGLSFTIAPTVGAASSGVERLWSLENARGLAADDPGSGGFEAERHLAAEVGYGLGAFGNHGLATPYAGVSLADGGGRTWRTGVRWALGHSVAFDLEGTRDEAANDDRPVHGLMLRGSLRW